MGASIRFAGVRGSAYRVLALERSADDAAY